MNITTAMDSYSQFRFKSSGVFKWSPRENTIHYEKSKLKTKTGIQALVHEISHALLDHKDYSWDIELVKMESEAWDQTIDIAKQYGINIDQEHIESCLESYRQWIYQRSLCPNCSNAGVQQSLDSYCCFLCSSNWKVSKSPVCKISRRIKKDPNS